MNSEVLEKVSKTKAGLGKLLLLSSEICKISWMDKKLQFILKSNGYLANLIIDLWKKWKKFKKAI